MPKVSVIVPTYNCVQYLPEAIESALGQTYKDFEIIVIDDGSTDNTKEVVQTCLNEHPDVMRYVYQENQGLAVARNTAIKNAKGKYIALLDSDDQWLPQRLEETVRVIEKDESIGLVHANIIRIAANGTPIDATKRNKEYLSGDIFEYLFLRKAHLACPTVLFRKECCDRVGLFDENLARLGCEDRELWLRITQQYKTAYVDKVLAHYRVSGSSMSRNKDTMMKARMYVVDKFCPAEGPNRPLRRKALAKIFHDLGDEFLFEKNFTDSRKQYAKALSFAPLSLWTWINFTKTLLKIKVKHVPES